MNVTTRRTFIGGGIAALAYAMMSIRGFGPKDAAATPAHAFEVTKSDEEWRKALTPAQYDVLRREGTERPFTSPLNAEHRAGKFTCAGCALDLFSSKAKFDSGTGWPSFWEALPKAVDEHTDTTFGMRRTGVVCRRCGGHLGHVFDDGPKPTGLRYCMNGVSMNFSAVAT